MSKKWMDAMIIPYPPNRPARTCTFECEYSDGSTSTEVTGERVVSLTYRYAKSPATSITVSASPSAAYGSNANSMFTSCSSLRTLTLPEGFGSGVTDMSYMFNYCSALTTLNLPEGFGADVTNAGHMFDGCTRLATINGGLAMKVSFDLSPTALDEASLVRVLDSLQAVSGKTLTLGETLKAKLASDAGKAALAGAEARGWTIK